jgi:cytochrome c peroxidase
VPGQRNTATLLAACLLIGGSVYWLAETAGPQWSEAELDTIESLWLGNLGDVPADPTNEVADSPAAAALGHRLFFDTRLSRDGDVSCATCHKPESYFTDGLTVGIGAGVGTRHTMTVVGTAWSPWYFWDGRRDSQWSQAITPLESPAEHAGTRAEFVHLLAQDADYAAAYERIFGPLPDLTDRERFPRHASPLGSAEEQDAWSSMDPADQNAVNRAFANMGKALAAYQRHLRPGPSRFDAYARALASGRQPEDSEAFSAAEAEGLRLFIGEASCIDCHNGPLFTNNEFHNTGVLPGAGQLPGMGRATGVREAWADVFNCLGPFSADPEQSCAELRFARTGDDLVGTQRTPSLRNASRTPPFMHAGQIASLRDVLEHYRRAEPSLVGHNEAKPLDLRQDQMRFLEAFLRTLDGGVAAEDRWLKPPEPG